MTKTFAKAASAAVVTSLPSAPSQPGQSLREVISTQIELLIEILDRMDGDWDDEPELIEDEHLDEASIQPVSLGPKLRTVKHRQRSNVGRGVADRDQASYRSEFSDAGGAAALHADAARQSTRPRLLGLRESVRNRVVRHGTEVPTDAELLGALLSLVMPCNSPEVLADRLIRHFGGFSAALAAPVPQLAGVEGMGRVSATNLKIILAAARRFGRDQIDLARPILSSWTQLLDYCRVTMAFEEIEYFRLLLLNKRNCLIADEVQQRGTVDHTPVYPREVIKRSLEVGATAIILVHNHPSGDPAPSAADVRMTKEIIAAAKPLGIIVHDHIIIGRKGHASLKALRLM